MVGFVRDTRSLELSPLVKLTIQTENTLHSFAVRGLSNGLCILRRER